MATATGEAAVGGPVPVAEIADAHLGGGWLTSLRRHDPDQVRRV